MSNVSSKVREALVTTAADLLTGSPGEPEYIRGMVELIAQATISGAEDADDVKYHVERRIIESLSEDTQRDIKVAAGACARCLDGEHGRVEDDGRCACCGALVKVTDKTFTVEVSEPSDTPVSGNRSFDTEVPDNGPLSLSDCREWDSQYNGIDCWGRVGTVFDHDRDVTYVQCEGHFNNKKAGA